MQVQASNYNSDKHDIHKCLTVKQPYAGLIATGAKTIEVRKKPTKYRGELMISSSKKPITSKAGVNGALICSVVLMDCLRVKDLNEDQWIETMIDEDQNKYIDQYAWVLASPKRTIEIPIKGNLGIWNLYIGKADIEYYPAEISGIEKFIGNQKPGLSKKLRRRAILIFAWSLAIIIAAILASI